MLEGGQQPVDFDWSGRSQRLGKLRELLWRELRSGQDIGRGGAAGDRLGARKLAEQKREEALIGFGRGLRAQRRVRSSEARRDSWYRRRSGAGRARARLDRVVGSGSARAAATASGIELGIRRGLSSSAAARPEIQLDGTCFSFRPDQAMACKLLCRAACGAEASRKRVARSSWIGRGLCQAAQLFFQFGALGRRQIGPIQPLAQDAGRRACPFAVPAHDP